MAKTQDILTNQIYPRLYDQANKYFPEFALVKNHQGWRSTNTLKIDGTKGTQKAKVYVYANNPKGFKDYRVGFKSFWDYIAQRDRLHTPKDIFLRLAQITGVDLEQDKSYQSVSNSTTTPIVPLSKTNKPAKINSQINLPLLYQAQEIMVANLQTDDSADSVRKYLTEERKVSLQEARELKLGFLANRNDLKAQLVNKFPEPEVKTFLDSLTGSIGKNYQLMIPYITVDLEHRGFIARAISVDDNQPKYLYSKGMKRSDTLFSSDCISPGNPLVIVEGIFDSLIIQKRLDIPAVALGGTSLNDGQLAKIKSNKPSLVILALDNDAAGNAAAMNIISKMQSQAPELPYRILQTPAYFKDPDGWIKEQGISPFSASLKTVMDSYSPENSLTTSINRNSVLVDFLSDEQKQKITYQQTVKSKQFQA